MSKSDKSKRVIADVRIVDASLLPPSYFFKPSVLDALQREVREDVVVRGGSVPPGVAAVYADYTNLYVSNASPAPGRRRKPWGLIILGVVFAVLITLFILGGM